MSGAASTSRSSRCAIRPTAPSIRCIAQIRAPVLYLPEYLTASRGGCCRAWLARPGGCPAIAPPARALARRSGARPDAQPHPPLRPGAGAGGRAAAGDRPPARAFPAHAGFGRALCRDDARPRLDGLGARQGHLDHARLGEAREAGRAAHGRSPAPQLGRAPSGGAGAAEPERVALSITASISTASAPPPGRARARDGSDPAGRWSCCRSAARSKRRATTICSPRWRCCRRTLHWRFVHIGGGAAGASG